MSREPGLKTTANFRSELMLEGSPLSFAMGHVIFKQGGHGNSFFYIVEGQVELQFDGRTRRILRTGDFFGELRVLGNLPRTATATCLTACQLIMLTAEQLNALVAEVPSVRKMILSKYGARLMHSRMRAHTEKIPLKDADYVEIISKFEPLSISREYRLITEGDPSDALYLVLRGKGSYRKNPS
jgi:CRP-like cAMP-binding protein